jgi:hypothetical protein
MEVVLKCSGGILNPNGIPSKMVSIRVSSRPFAVKNIRFLRLVQIENPQRHKDDDASLGVWLKLELWFHIAVDPDALD